MYSVYGEKNLGLCNVTIWVAFSRCRSATVLDAVYFNLKHEQGVRASDNGSEDGNIDVGPLPFSMIAIGAVKPPGIRTRQADSQPGC